MLLTDLSSSTPSNLLLCLCESSDCSFHGNCHAVSPHTADAQPIKSFSIERWTPAEDVSPSKHQLSLWWTGFLWRDKPFTCEHDYFKRRLLKMTVFESMAERNGPRSRNIPLLTSLFSSDCFPHHLPAITKQAENEQFEYMFPLHYRSMTYVYIYCLFKNGAKVPAVITNMQPLSAEWQEHRWMQDNAQNCSCFKDKSKDCFVNTSKICVYHTPLTRNKILLSRCINYSMSPFMLDCAQRQLPSQQPKPCGWPARQINELRDRPFFPRTCYISIGLRL